MQYIVCMDSKTFFFGNLPLDTIGEYYDDAQEFFMEHFRTFGFVDKTLVRYKLYFVTENKEVLLSENEQATPLARMIPEHYIVKKNNPAKKHFKLQMLYDEHHLQFLYFSS